MRITAWFTATIAILVGAVQSAAFAQNRWTFTIVDESGDVGRWASLALQPNGSPAVAYFESRPGNDDRLKYAEYSGGAWLRYDLGGSGGAPNPLRFTASGAPMIAHQLFGPTNPALDAVLLTRVGQSWNSSSIDSLGDVGRWISLSEVAGVPAVAYFDATLNALKYARSENAEWITSFVDLPPSPASAINLVHAADGAPFITYCAANNLWFAERIGGVWHASLLAVGGVAVEYGSLAIGSNAALFVSYTRFDDLYLAARINGIWTHSRVFDPAGEVRFSSIRIQSNGRPVIAFDVAESAAHSLWLARPAGSAWDVRRVDPTDGVGEHCSLELARDGRAMIAYYDDLHQSLRLAQQCPWGDLSGDGLVGLDDLSMLLSNFGTSSVESPLTGDFDGDGAVGLSDLSLLLSNFGTRC